MSPVSQLSTSSCTHTIKRLARISRGLPLFVSGCSRGTRDAGYRFYHAAAELPASERPVDPQALPQPVREGLPPGKKQVSQRLTDTFGRGHDYLRISITERCNLRCLYCMPEEGVPLSPIKQLLTTPEITLLSSLFVSQGVTKIRLTGGEPTVRPDIVPLMRQIGALRANGLRELCLTSNGLTLHRKLDDMVDAGLTGVNLSLDTLDPWQFQIMTRRQGFSAVKKSIDKIFELNRHGAAIKFKINCVVMRGVNDAEILPFVELTRDSDVEVRFIEYMPFDGNRWNRGKMISYIEMLDRIRVKYPELEKVRDHKNDTSKTWHIPGFAGRVGFITSMTHNFCGTCNRLRITSDGSLKVCLFGNTEVSLRDMLRKANGGEPIDEAALSIVQESLGRPAVDGLTTQLSSGREELLDVIERAVKAKKAKHAGLGELEHMKNRPMILIGPESGIIYDQPLQPWRQGYGQVGRRQRQSSLMDRLWHVAPLDRMPRQQQSRLFSTSATCAQRRTPGSSDDGDRQKVLTHVSASGSAHMVSITKKEVTARVASAACTVLFSSDIAVRLILNNEMKKGDVLAVARVAGIMASKRTSDLIPLCHPISLSHAAVEFEVDEEANEIHIKSLVTCDGKTGVEMEALTAASTAALTIYDMCKAVDKGIIIQGLRVVLKDGGKSGRWEMA